MIYFCIFIFISLSIPGISSGDTLVLNDGKRVKGLILNEYKDRIVLSTMDGEKYFMKSDIRSAAYNSKTRELVQVARNQVKKRQYVKAYYTYKKVLESDPDMSEASERLDFLGRYMDSKIMSDIVGDIERKGLYEKSGKSSPDQLSSAEELGDVLGIHLTGGDKYVYIEKLTKDSAGYKAGLLKNDRIVSVWGEMTAFMDVQEVSELLSGPYEARFEVERNIMVDLGKNRSILGNLFGNYRGLVGAQFELEREGLTVSRVFSSGPFSRSGIKEGDIIRSINGVDIKYMQLSKVIGLIRKNRNAPAEFIVRRSVTVWGKDGFRVSRLAKY